MAKPTLLQSILKRPSHSYSFPKEKKDYHSSKRQLIAAASINTPINENHDDDDGDEGGGVHDGERDEQLVHSTGSPLGSVGVRHPNVIVPHIERAYLGFVLFLDFSGPRHHRRLCFQF
jgi:hypothetical protein